ncbi:MAG TPA: GAF domain-containing sensor histidine kinase [Acidimicrobiales bacterium]|nr:GAF domain-containing sensor histidine kinase [Acidimicrobiales bacterium]
MATRRPARSAEERLARVLELQRILAQVAREIGPALELEPVLKTVLGAMRSLVDFKGGTIQLRDERGVFIAAADPENLVSEELRASRVPVGKGLSGRVVQTGQTIYSPDLWDDERVDKDQARLNEIAHSYLAVPLIVTGEVVGALQIDSEEIDAFDSEDIALMEGLAVQVAGAIEGARRHESEVELERMKSDFIARISHELRTPLTIMGGFTDTLLLHGDRLDAEQRAEVLNRVKNSVGRLSALIEEILTVASFEAGMTQVKLEDVHLRSLLEQVRDLSIDSSRVDLTVPDDIFVVTDPVILRHILNQLVDNALKYAGDAKVTAGRGDGDGLAIVVADDGPGIPESEWSRVFQRFYRGNHTGAGMGLGLPVARDLCQRLGASLQLESPPEGGARFTIRFA